MAEAARSFITVEGEVEGERFPGTWHALELVLNLQKFASTVEGILTTVNWIFRNFFILLRDQSSFDCVQILFVQSGYAFIVKLERKRKE